MEGSEEWHCNKQILPVNNHSVQTTKNKKSLSPHNQAKENHQRSNYISELLSWFPVPPQKV